MAIPQTSSFESLLYASTSHPFWVERQCTKAFYLADRKVSFVVKPCNEGRKWILEGELSEKFEPNAMLDHPTGGVSEIKRTTIPSDLAEKIQKTVNARLNVEKDSEREAAFDVFMKEVDSVPDEAQLKEKLGEKVVNKLNETVNLTKSIENEEMAVASTFNELIKAGKINITD